MILHIHLFITLQDNSNMGDLITMPELLQKLEDGKLIPEELLDEMIKNLMSNLLTQKEHDKRNN